MGSIPDQFPISLRAWPSKGEKTSQLSTLISRINAERGSFRAVSEETLQQEIDKGDACAVDSSSSDEDDSEDEPDKAKELMTAREEMLGQLELV
jgi:mediator of RNA polymerase II transcription subunit 17